MDASPRRVRRRRVNAPGSNDRLADAGSDSDDCSPNGSNEMIPLRIGDTPKVLAYYEGALKHFQQLNCRMVAKAFIKFIEPRKQVRHPYNGGKPPAGSAPGTTGDPEKTKPLWWPPGVMHKEPDHLRKECMSFFWYLLAICLLTSLPDRIELLLHIIRKLGDYGITADKLKEVAGDTKRSLKHSSHVDIIYEILRVRKMEERFERGEVGMFCNRKIQCIHNILIFYADASMVVYVMNRGPSPKGDDEEESNDTTTLPVPTLEAPEHIEEGLLTPTSSIEHVTAPLTTPLDPLSMAPTRSLPTSFSLSQPLSFDGPRQDRPYYTTPPQYTDSFSQPMLSTPVTAEMISPHDVSVFDYSTSHGFPTSTADQKFDGWAPTFRQNLFSPVDYNAPAGTHGLPQPPMHYHMSMASPAQLHDMSHPHTQSPLDPMSQRTLPFRTGSLGHPHGLPLAHQA